MINTPKIPSIQAQVDEMQQQAAGRIPPEVAARNQARRERLIATGIANQSLHMGETAPDFTLPDAYGKPVTLSDLLKTGPVILTFYRGDWCPFCNITLRAYQAILPQITELHGTLVAVSPQNADHTLLTAQNKELTYPVLSDVGNQIARQYRLVWTIPEENRATSPNLPEFNGDESWELPMAGTFIIGQDHIVKLAFVKEDWTSRLEPATILETLQQIAS